MKLKFYRKVLKNGMTIVFEKRDLPVASVVIAVRNGGINEKPSEKGISHFIEHMLYKGTPTRNSRKIAEEIEKNGGELNGFTDETITAFWCKIPSAHLNLALEVLTDMVKNPLLDKEEMEKERKVIFEEIHMRKDTPHIYVLDNIQNELYSGTLGLNLIGDYKTMGAINRSKMLEKFEQIYQPNNMILGIVGDANFEEIVQFAERNFGNQKGNIPKIKFSLKNNSKIEKRKGIDQANLIFAYHVPLARDKKSYAALALGTLMAGGMSSRLFSEIREKRNLAYSVKGDSNINKEFAYNIIYVGTKKENVEKVKILILKEFKEVAETLTEKELNQVKEQLVGNYKISMEDSQTQLINLLTYEIEGNAKEFYNFEKDIRAVKLEDVKKLAKIKNYSFFALVPEGK
jgi:predicted Zn-dependent peptidase